MSRPTVSRGSERRIDAVAGRPVSSATTTTSAASRGRSDRTPWSRTARASPGRAAQAQTAALPSTAPAASRCTTK
ncbi:hypothetical protein ACFW4L_36140, partial [Streptomyces sp. NPDC058832]|uniref:hypothetical protein n=1 Tax=Streptomyces sp. NPDC058832 TaxID=3346646 RepID=UPI0036A8A6AB